MAALPTAQFTRSLNAALVFWKLQGERGVASQLDRDRQNLNRAIKMGLVLPDTQLTAIQAVLSAFNLVYDRGYWWEWLPVLELAIELCPADAITLKVDLLNQYGNLLRFSGYATTAVSAHEGALVLATQLGDPLKLGETHARLGQVYREAGQFDKAEYHCQAALNELDMAGEAGLSLTASVLATFGRMARRRGDVQAAKDYLGRAVVIWRQLSDTLRLAQGLNDLGAIYQDDNEFDEAFRFYSDAMQLLTETEHKLDYLHIQYSLGVLLFGQQLWSRAEAAFREIDLDYLRQTGNMIFEARVITALGNAILYQQRPEEAAALLQRAVTLWEQLDYKVELANAIGSLGEAWALAGEQVVAKKQFLKALALLGELPGHPRVLRLRSLFTAELQKLETEQGKGPVDIC